MSQIEEFAWITSTLLLKREYGMQIKFTENELTLNIEPLIWLYLTRNLTTANT